MMDYSFLQFRNVHTDDIGHINKLMREGKKYWGYPEEGLDRFMSTFGIKDESYFEHGFGFRADMGDEIIGYYLFKTDESSPMLDHLFLDTRYIGKGYGRHLWNHCLQQASKKGWKEFVFWADPHALPFYERMGAVVIDHRPMVTMPGYTAPIMKFVLA